MSNEYAVGLIRPKRIRTVFCVSTPIFQSPLAIMGHSILLVRFVFSYTLSRQSQRLWGSADATACFGGWIGFEPISFVFPPEDTKQLVAIHLNHKLAPVQGFEPWQTVLETVVLPLHHTDISWQGAHTCCLHSSYSRMLLTNWHSGLDSNQQFSPPSAFSNEKLCVSVSSLLPEYN